jgi:hypothetical protein
MIVIVPLGGTTVVPRRRRAVPADSHQGGGGDVCVSKRCAAWCTRREAKARQSCSKSCIQNQHTEASAHRTCRGRRVAAHAAVRTARAAHGHAGLHTHSGSSSRRTAPQEQLRALLWHPRLLTPHTAHERAVMLMRRAACRTADSRQQQQQRRWLKRGHTQHSHASTCSRRHHWLTQQVSGQPTHQEGRGHQSGRGQNRGHKEGGGHTALRDPGTYPCSRRHRLEGLHRAAAPATSSVLQQHQLGRLAQHITTTSPSLPPLQPAAMLLESCCEPL